MKTKFPNVIAAATARRRHQNDAEGKDLWAFGAAIIKDCGKPEDPDKPSTSGVRGSRGHHDGSYARIEAATEALKEHGFPDYPLNSLLRIRDITLTFPASTRVDGLGFYAHGEALNPEVLEWIIKTTPKKAKKKGVGIIDVLTIREKVALWRERHNVERKRKNEQAQFKKRAAKTPREVEEAEREIEETKAPPKGRELPAPSKEQGPVVLKELALMRLAREARALAEEAKDGIGDVVHELDKASVDVMHEEAMKTASAWSEVATTIRKVVKSKGHLSSVA